jgi:membrane associated rhomboid family serine protease
VLGGIVAAYTQALLTAGSTVPAIGASGAIAGVLGGYLLLFPRARVLTLLLVIFFVTIIEIPAAILLAIWFVLQFLPALGQVTTSAAGGEGVAYWAHVGGFAFGLAAIKLFANRYPSKALDPQSLT